MKIYLLDYIKPLWKHRVACFLIVLCCTSSAILYSFFMPKLYCSEAIIIPEESHSSSTGASGLLGGFSGLVGNRSGINKLVMYLSSRTVQKRVAEAIGVSFLNKNNAPLDDQKIDKIIDMLNSMVNVTNDRIYPDKIKIQVSGNDPQLVTYVAKQFLVELQNFIADNILTGTKRYRIFLEKQIARSKEETLEMGKALTSFYGENSISAESAKLNVPVGLYTNEGVRNFKNYEEFKQHFETIQRKQNDGNEKMITVTDNEEVRVVHDVPHQLYLQYLTTQQQILENDLAMLSQQYQMAKLEETKQEPSFQVLNEPLVPRFPFSPNKKFIAKTSFIVSLFLALFYSLYREFFPYRVNLFRHKRKEDLVSVDDYKAIA